MKNKILVLLSIVLITLIGITLYLVKNEQNKEKNEEYQKETEEFVQMQNDGTRINTSSKLNEEKELEGLKIENIQLIERDGQLNLIANVTNIINKDIESFYVDIILYDKEGNEIDTILGIIPTVKSNKTVELKAGITENYVNAYDFKIVKR